MADEYNETQDAEQQEQLDAKRQAERDRRLFLQTPATARWNISQEDFRRIARTGEFSPETK